ncbi:MAG: hypothetical protein P8X98_13595, partial [Woeseiaceae bacterium]
SSGTATTAMFSSANEPGWPDSSTSFTEVEPELWARANALAHRAAHSGGITDLHAVGYVVIVTAILRH